jgi:hypothetical protein
MDIEARDLTTGRRLRATLLETPASVPRDPGGEGDSVPRRGRRPATVAVRQRTPSPPGLSAEDAAWRVLARTARAWGRSPEAAAAAFLGGFAALFAEALRRRGV